MNLQWKKIVTREIPLLSLHYTGKGYCLFKNTIGAQLDHALLVNDKGLMTRYLIKGEVEHFCVHLREIAHEGKIAPILHSAVELDTEIEEIINEFLRCEDRSGKFMSGSFERLNEIFAQYWSHYLIIYFTGLAYENTQYENIIHENAEIYERLRGEGATRNRVEEEYLPLLLSEIEKNLHIDPKLLLYAFPEELAVLLRSERVVDESVLAARKESYVWLMNNGEDHYYFGADATKVRLRELGKEEQFDDVSELRGVVAAKGSEDRYTGKVRVILRKEEMKGIKKGDVLVTPMTTPVYLPAMESAGAFVTDEGGITCHAAIVAREMGKLCIIGTKNATQVLKDGMMVEVDANEGVVKILK